MIGANLPLEEDDIKTIRAGGEHGSGHIARRRNLSLKNRHSAQVPIDMRQTRGIGVDNQDFYFWWFDAKGIVGGERVCVLNKRLMGLIHDDRLYTRKKDLARGGAPRRKACTVRVSDTQTGPTQSGSSVVVSPYPRLYRIASWYGKGTLLQFCG